ncbi:hypothetical protein ILYODFUR_018563 [Ilyodon furcidens]|uniref:Uncharacterized protein n=1 Tax=Ilyodon furcidens TaxID=33524 RepID=A0ABV0TWW6_9TELE
MSDIENNFQPCVCFVKLRRGDDYSHTVFSLVKSKQHKSSAVRSSETRQQVLYILICSMSGRQSYKKRPGNGPDIPNLICTINPRLQLLLHSSVYFVGVFRPNYARWQASLKTD